MLKTKHRPPEDDDVPCDGPTCNVRKPKNQMRPMHNGTVRVCSGRCMNLWTKKYELGQDVTGY